MKRMSGKALDPKCGIVFCLLLAMLLPARAPAQTSAYSEVNIAGSFNGWNTTTHKLTLIANNTWSGDFSLTNRSFEFKFTTPGWTANWGDNNQPNTNLQISGTGDSGGANIKVTNGVDNALLRFTINTSTREYTAFLLNNVGTNLLLNGGFETQGSASYLARYWAQNEPNLHGYRSGAGVDRSDYGGGHGGSWKGAILGGWAGYGGNGTFWQEAPVEPGLPCAASAWFLAEVGTWTSAVQELRLDFFDFNKTNLLASYSTNLAGVTTSWSQYSVTGAAPAQAAWARLVFNVAGAGNDGSLQMDDAGLSATANLRSEDFNAWAYASGADGNYLRAGWMINTGRTISAIGTQEMARSGYAAYLANPGAATSGAGFVQSPKYQDGVGTISFWYRHGSTDLDDDPTNPVHLLVQVSAVGDFWTTVGEVRNIVNINYQQANIYTYQADPRYVRIVHAGGSTNRVLIDDVSIGLPEVAPRYMDFNGWDSAGTNLGAHTYLQWLVQTGRVWDVDAHEGKSAFLPGSSTTVNFVRSPFFEGGYGTISFLYARGTNGTSPARLQLEYSANGTNWTVLETIANIVSPSYSEYEKYFYNPFPAYVRICNVTNPPGTAGNVLIDEGFAGGVTPPAGWTFFGISSTYSSAGNFGREPPSIRFTNSWITTPPLVKPTNVLYWTKGQGINPSSYLLVESTSNDSTWVIIASNSAIGNTARIYTNVVSTNATRLRFRSFKAGGNLAFDDVIVYGQPAAAGSPQNLLLDNISIGEADLVRSQNFNEWPTSSSYGNSEFQGWTVVNAIINTEKAESGQAARLRDGSDPKYILSPFLAEGLGAVTFDYRRWDDGTAVNYLLQTSTNGTTWTNRDTIAVTSSNYTEYSRYFNITNGVYVRLNWSNGSRQVLFDNIDLSEPAAPATVNLSGTHEPSAPYSNDTVALVAQALALNGARGISVTSYYRVGTSGAWTAAGTIQDGSTYTIVSNIPAKPIGTIVQYYFKAWFDGPGAELSRPVYYPANTNSPLWYGIPRNPPGKVWINEIDYQSHDWDTNNWEFIELAGEAGMNISGWKIELRDGSTTAYALFDSYTIPTTTTIPSDTNGFGFFVLGGGSLASPPRDLLLTNYLHFHLPGAVRLLNEMNGLEYSLSYDGSIPTYDRIPATDEDFFPPMLEAVILTGTGASYEHFEWSTNMPPTPGAGNPGQQFAEPSEFAAIPTNLVFSYIPDSFSPDAQTMVISNAGSLALTYTVTTNVPWLTVTPTFGSNLAVGAKSTHTVSVNTEGLLGNKSGELVFTGNAGNSPFSVPVALNETALDTAILYYGFDDYPGETAFNDGTAGLPGNLGFQNGITWSPEGGGVSQTAGDFALVSTGGLNHARSTGAVAAVHSVTQFTITGWVKTTATGGVHRLFGNRANTDGFALMTSTNYQNLALVSSATGAPAAVISTNNTLATGAWRFFAVTFDGTNNTAAAVKFYGGATNLPSFLSESRSRGGLGPTGVSTGAVFVAGDLAGAFVGSVDDFRFYSGVKDLMSVEAIRREALQGGSTIIAPTILSQPQSATVDVFDILVVGVTAEGTPNPTYQWRKGGTPLPGQTENSITFNPILLSDAGTYDVVVSNVAGWVVSSQALVVVLSAPEVVTAPTSVVVYAGETVYLQVNATGTPSILYQWKKAGSALPGETNPLLTLVNVQTNQAGSYSVTLTNRVTFSNSVSATLTVKVLNMDEGGWIHKPASTSGAVLRWPAISNRWYEVWWSSNLMNGVEGFVPVNTNLSLQVGTNFVVFTDTVYGIEGRGFYQIRSRTGP